MWILITLTVLGIFTMVFALSKAASLKHPTDEE